MRTYPTLAVIEFASIADGIFCTDALLKKAPIAMIKSGTVSRGRYLIIIGGSTASVEESLNQALAVGQAQFHQAHSCALQGRLGGADVGSHSLRLKDCHRLLHDTLTLA